jgi:hypothetical protein
VRRPTLLSIFDWSIEDWHFIFCGFAVSSAFFLRPLSLS